ncbi:MAG: HNH endonuclease [Anaerolineae bacterium]|nr:HNH endonuclease [Anaerolineae bacterium]
MISTERFWSKVEKTEDCWIWTGAKSKHGYGRFKVERRLVLPHRFAYEVTYGSIPDGYLICHRCDNPSCVRPDHLFLGTYKDNAVDAYLKGRMGFPELRGSQRGSSKLTENDVKEIRDLYQIKHLTFKSIAEIYKVNATTIRDAVVRRSWAWLD